MMKLNVILMICALLGALTANAETENWDMQGGWKVRHSSSPEYWMLYHVDRTEQTWNRTTACILRVDRRQDLPMAQIFEELKEKVGEIEKSPALIAAESKPVYERYAAAMLALTKIKAPEAYAAKQKETPIIGYEAVDSVSRPHCVLIAREYAGGGVIYATITDKTDALFTEMGPLRDAVHSLMDQINEKAAPELAPSVPNATSSKLPCKGNELFDDWVVVWSPKRATVYVRKPVFADATMMQGKKAKFGFMIHRDVDEQTDEETLSYSIFIPAEADKKGLTPQKQSLSVDGQVVQEWDKGGGQWAVLSDKATAALLSGSSAEMRTAELGRIRFQLKDLSRYLQLGNIRQQQAEIKTKLGQCE